MSSTPPFSSRLDSDIDSDIDPAIVQQAIIWAVTLQSGAASDHEQQSCEAWRQSHPEHERAWQRLASLGTDLRKSNGTVPPPFIRAVLRGTDHRTRRVVLKSLIGLGVIGGSFMAVREQPAWQALVADHHAATGEQRRLTLADGTQLMLDTDTVIDVSFDDHLRQVQLRRGEIMVTTAFDPLQRPFEIATRHGRIRPIGTRFTVAHDIARRAPTTTIAVIEGAVDVIARQDQHVMRVNAGQQTHFTADGLLPPYALDEGMTAWIDNMLVVERMRLADFIDELGRYRKGFLRCDPAVADLRVSGAFPLDNVDAVLSLLAETLPIKVVHATRFWTTVRASSDNAA